MTTTKQTFVVWAPDYTDPEAPSRRRAARPKHLEGIKQIVAQGNLKFGGPTSDPESGVGNGSMLVVEAESAAAVRAILEKDAYWDGNVWDKEKIDIRAITPVNVGPGQSKV